MTTELKPCPFCQSVPELPSGDGTQYEIECNRCGQAIVSIQICDLMTIDERFSDSFTNYRHSEEFIKRAKVSAIEKWNTRVVPELARYDHGMCMMNSVSQMYKEEDGEYVRYDQHVAVVADIQLRLKNTETVLDLEIDANIDAKIRAETAEAANAAKDKEIAGLRKAVGKADKALYREKTSLRNTRKGFKALKEKLDQIKKQEPVGRFMLSEGQLFQILDPEIAKHAIPLYSAPVASDADLRAERAKAINECAEIADNMNSFEVYDAISALNQSEPQT